MTLQVIYPLYKTELIPVKDNRGNKVKDDLGRYIKEEKQKLIKNVNVPLTFYIDDIRMTGGLLTEKGTVAKTKCVIYDRNTARYYNVNHTSDQERKAMSLDTYQPIGFLGHLQQTNKTRK
jgi:hypothetical protein